MYFRLFSDDRYHIWSNEFLIILKCVHTHSTPELHIYILFYLYVCSDAQELLGTWDFHSIIVIIYNKCGLPNDTWSVTQGLEMKNMFIQYSQCGVVWDNFYPPYGFKCLSIFSITKNILLTIRLGGWKASGTNCQIEIWTILNTSTPNFCIEL